MAATDVSALQGGWPGGQRPAGDPPIPPLFQPPAAPVCDMPGCGTTATCWRCLPDGTKPTIRWWDDNAPGWKQVDPATPRAGLYGAELAIASDPVIEFFVPGKPQQQGSKVKGQWGNIREDNKNLGPWRERVALAAYAAAKGRRFERHEPVAVGIEFVLYRPASLPKRKPTPPATKAPDVDKLERAINDALTHVLWEDDAQVTVVLKRKRVAEPGESPGAHVWVSPA
jgi:crossover junction endodeoxyribonuclease RusA